jgi:hypothetical protein
VAVAAETFEAAVQYQREGRLQDGERIYRGVLAREEPSDDEPQRARLAGPPREGQRTWQTFCGTRAELHSQRTLGRRRARFRSDRDR